MFCKNCGKKIDPKYNVCMYCGHIIQEENNNHIRNETVNPSDNFKDYTFPENQIQTSCTPITANPIHVSEEEPEKKSNKKLIIIITSSISAVLLIAIIILVFLFSSSEKINIPDDAVEFNGHYYKIFDESQNWHDAKDICEKMGGHLITINTQSESEFITDLLTDRDNRNCYWTAIKYNNEEDKWVHDNGSVLMFFNWADNEPNNFENHDEAYVHLFGNKYDDGAGNKEIGEWNDVSSDGAEYASKFYALSEFGYICEWETSGKKTCLAQLEAIDNDHYTDNEGDSCLFNLDGNGVFNKAYSRNGNTGINNEVFNDGFEAWIARWNYSAEKSWAYNTYNLNSQYKVLTGKTSLINSYNTTNFNTTIKFMNGDKVLASYTLTPDEYEVSIRVNVSGVDNLKILVKDNEAVCGGTSFAIYDLFLK